MRPAWTRKRRGDSAPSAFGLRIAAMSNLKTPSELKKIPVVEEVTRARSGEKYVTPQGFTAIRDGIKAQGGVSVKAPLSGKPAWQVFAEIRERKNKF